MNTKPLREVHPVSPALAAELANAAAIALKKETFADPAMGKHIRTVGLEMTGAAVAMGAVNTWLAFSKKLSSKAWRWIGGIGIAISSVGAGAGILAAHLGNEFVKASNEDNEAVGRFLKDFTASPPMQVEFAAYVAARVDPQEVTHWKEADSSCEVSQHMLEFARAKGYVPELADKIREQRAFLDVSKRDHSGDHHIGPDELAKIMPPQNAASRA